jgi:uncharacterized protein (TIGR03382 family)
MIRSIAFVVAALAGAAQGQTWTEVGDAGSLPGTAQITVGVGPLTDIIGTLFAREDMYCIEIVDPAHFLATAVGGAGFDTQLFLFDRHGAGVSFNDDSASTLQSTLTGAFVPGPGHYFLAITQFDNDALNGAGLEMWADTPFGAERPQDGAPGTIAGWSGSGDTTPKPYRIHLRGATYCVVPAPGALALAGLAGLVGLRRRR